MRTYFNSNNQPTIDLDVYGLNRHINTSALIDTGFSGHLTLSIPEALSIGLKLIAIAPVELANGKIYDEFVFEGKVKINKNKLPVEIFLTNSDENLIGSLLLQNRKLTIDYAAMTVDISSQS